MGHDGVTGNVQGNQPEREPTSMFPGYYHNPPKPVSTRVRCPVCQKEVYSRAGIHPQCAVKRWESENPTRPAVVATDSGGGPR